MINTNTKIKNLEGSFFKKENRDGTKADLSVGDVIVNEINRASGLELKITWNLMSLFSKDSTDVVLNPEQVATIKKVLEDAAVRPFDDRYNITIYGRIVDYLENPEAIPEDCRPDSEAKTS
jgi:hypothetical protein